MKKIVLGSMVGAVLLGGSFLVTNAVANEEYVAIPNGEVRETLLGERGPEMLENVLTDEERADFLQYHSLPGSVFSRLGNDWDKTFDLNLSETGETSLEGLEALTDLERLYITGNLIDPTPITKLANLKALYLNGGDENENRLGGSHNLSYIKSLKNLEHFSMFMNTSNQVLTDLSVFDELEHLENVWISTQGTYPAVAVSRKNPNMEMYSPIALSKYLVESDVKYSAYIDLSLPQWEYEQMNEEEMEDYSTMDISQATASVNGMNLKWENIPVGIKYLNFSFEFRNSTWDSAFRNGDEERYMDMHGSIEVQIPIVWQD